MAELDLGRVVGMGVPAGGTDGDVLVKSGATDYDARWTNTPPLLGNIADLELTNTASRYYAVNEYLMYNGKLYQTRVAISPDDPLNPGDNGNLIETKVSNGFRVLRYYVNIPINNIPAVNTANNGVSVPAPPAGYSFLVGVPRYTDKGYPIVSIWISGSWVANAAILNPTATTQNDVAHIALFFIRGIVDTRDLET